MNNTDKLLARRQQLVAGLPALSECLRGSFFVRHRRCGSPGCRCAKGPGHRTANVTVTFPGGGTEQVSLPRELESTARRWIDNYARWWRTVEQVSAINRRLLKGRLVGADAEVRP
jgi:hypothetical protein